MSAQARTRRQRLLAPEVVQTSAMDCGPATLKCLLEGFGVPISYGRLREACQTDVDGTSIDTMEEIAVQLGLEAEQIMLPADHLFLTESAALPAIIVVRQPNGLTHFVVVWRYHGPFVQVMDPAIGRRWMTRQKFLEEVYVHTQNIPAGDWREWAGSDQFLDALRRRLGDLKVPHDAAKELIEQALSDSGWRTLGALDAAVRMVNSIVRSGGLRPGAQAARVLEAFFEKARNQASGDTPAIPKAYWSVQPGASSDGVEQLALKGVVLVRVLGQNAPAASEEDGARTVPVRSGSGTTGTPGIAESVSHPDMLRTGAVRAPSQLSPELVAALAEPPSRPARKLWELLRADGLLTPTALLGALAIAAGGLVIEALLFRALFDIGRDLNVTTQRLTAIGGICIFTLALVLLELPIAAGLFRMGRRLEAQLRVAFLEKIPRLVDRYFQSRLTSDMAERSHTVHWIRQLPFLGGELTRYSFELVLTTAGIIWLDRQSAFLATLAACLAVGLPLLLNPILVERDLRMRTHVGALSRFYLDALLGLVPIRAHGAERAVRSEHESLLVEWARASLGLQRSVVAVEGALAFTGFGLAAWLLFAYLQR